MSECDSSIHEWATSWLFPFFSSEPDKGALPHRVSADKKINCEQEGQLTAYYQSVEYSIESYATDDVMAEVEA